MQVRGEHTGQRCVLFYSFSFAHVRSCSEVISDERVHILMTSQAKCMRFMLEVRENEIS
jgi:hypothetical protein